MGRKKSSNVRVHVMLTESQYARIQQYSEDSGYSISEIMRRATDLYLMKLKKESPSG